jgi:ABC-type glycerol-3-phosphate transport system substrate-binding protein
MRLTALLAIVLATAACSGGSSAATSAGSGPSAPAATVLPASGTVKLSDGITYTVAAPGTTLRLDNLTLRIMGLRWEKHVPVTVTPPGTRVFAVFTVAIANNSDQAATVQPTQVWLRTTLNHTYLAAPGANTPRPLIGRQLQAGERTTGTLAFPLPGKQPGGLLVYRFGDTPAGARHVGIARYR